ncbi:hypothetical protein P3T16_005281, partial [Paraburkholderia sp. GAS42]
MGSAAAPGDAGEALVGQTSSSGVRLSDFMFLHSFLGPAIVPGVPEETLLRYNTGGSALMTGTSLVP